MGFNSAFKGLIRPQISCSRQMSRDTLTLTFCLASRTTNMPVQLGFIILKSSLLPPLNALTPTPSSSHQYREQDNSKLSCTRNSTPVFYLICYVVQGQLVYTASVIEKRVWSRKCNVKPRSASWPNFIVLWCCYGLLPSFVSGAKSLFLIFLY